MADKLLLITKFSGGLSSGSKSGIAGSFRWAQACDIHSDPDVLQVSAKTTKDSGTTIVDLPMFSCTNTVNTNTYVLGDTGKLYKRTSAGVWSVVTTLAGANAEGMGFFSGTNLIYGVSGDTQFTLDPASDAVVASYRALNSASYHPVEPFLDKVFTGSGRELVSTDASAIDYTSTTTGGGITIDFNYQIRCLKNLGNWLFIGATADNSSDARYFLWDGYSSKYNYSRTLKGEDGINAAVMDDEGAILIFAGKQGDVYQLSSIDAPLVKLKQLPRIEKDKTIEVYPQAVENYQGRSLFGFSSGTSATAERGVYSRASAGKDYSKVFNMDYAISTETTTGTTLQIGNLLAIDTNTLMIGWRDASTYGMDKVDGSSVQATALYESLIHDAGKPFMRKYYKNFKIILGANLATGEAITLSYKADQAASWTSIGTMTFASDGAIKEKRLKTDIKAAELELQLSITASGSTAPKVDALAVVFSEEPLI